MFLVEWKSRQTDGSLVVKSREKATRNEVSELCGRLMREASVYVGGEELEGVYAVRVNGSPWMRTPLSWMR